MSFFHFFPDFGETLTIGWCSFTGDRRAYDGARTLRHNHAPRHSQSLDKFVFLGGGSNQANPPLLLFEKADGISRVIFRGFLRGCQRLLGAAIDHNRRQLNCLTAAFDLRAFDNHLGPIGARLGERHRRNENTGTGRLLHADFDLFRSGRFEDETPFRHRAATLHHRHMEQRLDGLSCHGMRPFEKDVDLAGPESCLDAGSVAAVTMIAVGSRGLRFAMPLICWLGGSAAGQGRRRKYPRKALVGRRKPSDHCQQSDCAKHHRRTRPFIWIECHFPISKTQLLGNWRGGGLHRNDEFADYVSAGGQTTRPDDD